MERGKFGPYSLGDVGLGTFACAILYIYPLSYPPFVTASYLPIPVRIGIEGLTLGVLLMVALNYGYAIREAVWFLMVAGAFGFTLLLGIDVLGKTISSFNKIVFFILAVSLFLGNRRILYTCREIWIRLWFLLGAMAILGFVGYLTGVIKFSPFDLAASIGEQESTSYYYLNNPLFGNLMPRDLYGFSFGRVAGYVYEGGQLGFFFGFNILVAREWIDDKKRARRFVWINLLGGIATLSMTLFFFLLGYFCFNMMFRWKKYHAGIRTLVLLLVGVALIIAIPPLVIGLLVQSSGSVRLYDFYVYFKILESNSWLTWLFGNGIGISWKEPWGVGGIDSGLLGILIERGLIMLGLMVYMLARCTRHNRWVTTYALYYNCIFDFFWWPVFVLVIAMYYGCSYYLKKDLVIPKASAAFSRLMAT